MDDVGDENGLRGGIDQSSTAIVAAIVLRKEYWHE